MYSELEMRKSYAKTVEKLFKKDSNIFALEADLSSSMSTSGLKEIMGKNYINLGIMEANMIGVASSINLAGGYCFVHSFGQFLTRRAMDQIFISLGYSKLSACLVGSDAGVTAEHNGGTHMTFEDVGILRIIPNIEIYDVCDPVQFNKVLEYAYESKKLIYIRTARKKQELAIYSEETKFENTGANILKKGKSITILACGIEVKEALEAADKLEKHGIYAEVIDVYRIKPLNEEVILKSAQKTGRVITCENHSINNGLGSSVAELLSEKYPIKVKRIGINNRFGQVGKQDYLMKEYNLTADDIAGEAIKLI